MYIETESLVYALNIPIINYICLLNAAVNTYLFSITVVIAYFLPITIVSRCFLLNAAINRHTISISLLKHLYIFSRFFSTSIILLSYYALPISE